VALCALLVAALVLAPQARAATTAGVAVETHALRALTLPVASCPAGVPVQTLTVINQANARPFALARVENAIVAQSLQLRAAWGTPCVQFGPGGWPIYLKTGFGPDLGLHAFSGGPYAIVWTSAGTYVAWSQPFSHEVAEMLVDPTTQVDYTFDGSSSMLEIADPVEDIAYRLKGVWVSDFVLPAYFAGATLGACAVDQEQQWCLPTTVGDTNGSTPAPVLGGRLIAPTNAAGPYDEAGDLTEPLAAGYPLGL
jgi:hypothetical protein